MEPIGIVAGWGNLPVQVAAKAKAQGIPVICVGYRGMADRSALEPYCTKFYWTRLAALNSAARYFKKHGVRRWLFAGKVIKTNIYRPWRLVTLLPDLRMIRFWYFRKRSNNADDTIAQGVANDYARDGLECIAAVDICPELLVREGNLTQRTPTKSEEADIEYGWFLAKEMGRLDVGQSVSVVDRAVLAVEAIEGTDAAIRRAGELCRKRGFVVVKVAKPQQDMRFDVPTVGPSTIQTMREAGAKVLAIEAGKTIILDEAETVRLANESGIVIVSRSPISEPEA
jgi:DUF1009 family protein